MKANTQEIIARQAMEIIKLKDKLAIWNECAKKIYHELYDIGAPLNDNKLRYTVEQRKIFHTIGEYINYRGE